MYVAASRNELISLTSDAENSVFRKWKRTCHFWPSLGVLACDFASSSPSSFARQRPRRAPPPLPSVFFALTSFFYIRFIFWCTLGPDLVVETRDMGREGCLFAG